MHTFCDWLNLYAILHLFRLFNILEILHSFVTGTENYYF